MEYQCDYTKNIFMKSDLAKINAFDLHYSYFN